MTNITEIYLLILILFFTCASVTLNLPLFHNVILPETNMTLILFFFLQQYFAKLSERTVAYINVDIAVFGKKFHLSGEDENI